ncbi:MAG: hypothetical protein AAGB51_05690 [Planctomycetota bacterium]
MNRIAAWSCVVAILVIAWVGGQGGGSRALAVAPDTTDPESLFFEALLRDPALRDEALRSLEASVAGSAEADPAQLLWLGLCHLWIVAEGRLVPEEVVPHAREAARWLLKAEAAIPEDSRIPTWRFSAEWSLARLEGRRADEVAAREGVAALAADDACFHSVTLSIMSHEEPADSPEFVRSLDAMEEAFLCGQGDPSGIDAPRWPNNVRGFLAALSDLRFKAGDLAGAEAALVIAEARPGFDDWGFKSMIDERFERIAAAREGREIELLGFALSGTGSCLSCHAE